jgi:hypothetical protein
LCGTLALGCASETFLDPFPSALTFSLESANGGPLPVVLEETTSPPFQLLLLSASITITGDGVFRDDESLRQTSGGVVTNFSVSCFGTFSTSGNNVTFVEDNIGDRCGDTFSGTMTAIRVSVPFEGFDAVFVVQ